MMHWLLLILAATLNAVANIFIKSASSGVENSRFDQFTSIYFIAGIFLFGLNIIFYATALRHIQVVIAYPIFVACSILIITFISSYVFMEQLSLIQILGILVIMAGITIMLLPTEFHT